MKRIQFCALKIYMLCKVAILSKRQTSHQTEHSLLAVAKCAMMIYTSEIGNVISYNNKYSKNIFNLKLAEKIGIFSLGRKNYIL